MFLLPTIIGRLLAWMSECLTIISLILTLAYYLGWIHRVVWYLAEREARKALNGTPVTIGSCHFDVFRGRLWLSNIIIHSPRLHQWKWDSPLLARVGKAYVEANLVYCLLRLLICQEEHPLDIYTIQASDIQVFVERKSNFFNFFLLDRRVELPDPVLADDAADTQDSFSLSHNDDGLDDDEEIHRIDSNSPRGDAALATTTPSTTLENPTSTEDLTEEKANKLMDEMLRSLSRAAQEGSFQGALMEHKEKLTTKLKAIQTTRRKSTVMQEGVKIVQHVSKAVVEKTQTVQQVVRPTRRAPLPNEKVPYVRIGRIMIDELRIFTRDHAMPEKPKRRLSSWKRPIFIPEVRIRPSELCPSMTAKDSNNWPLLYQPIDACIDVVWKRVLAEGAKTNSGRIFQAAVQEVLDCWLEQDM